MRPPLPPLGVGQKGLLTGHRGFCASVAYSPDGRWIVTGGTQDNTVRIWDAVSMREMRVLSESRGRIRCVAVSPDSRWVAAAWDNQVRVYDFGTWEVSSQFDASATCLGFVPGRDWLAVGCYEGALQRWDLLSGRIVDSIELDADCRGIAHSADGSMVFVATAKSVSARNIAGGREEVAWPLVGVNSIAVFPDGKRIAVGLEDGTVRVLDMTSKEEVACLDGHTEMVQCVVVSADGQTVASGSDDRTILLWDMAWLKPVQCLRGHQSQVFGLAWSPDGDTLASCSSDTTIRLWDPTWRGRMPVMQDHEGFVKCIAVSSAGYLVATGGGWGDGTVRVWDSRIGTCQHRLEGNGSQVDCLAFSQDGEILAVASHSITLWHPVTGSSLGHIDRPESGVSSLSFLPCGESLASGWDDGTVRVWDVTSVRRGRFARERCDCDAPRERRCLQGHEGRVDCLSCDSAGYWIASGGADNTVRVWDADAGVELHCFRCPDNITAVACSPRLEVIARIGDGLVIAWDITNGNKTREFREPGQLVPKIVNDPELWPWHAVGRGMGTTFEKTTGGAAFAWFPAFLGSGAADVRRGLVAGSNGPHLLLLKLEGEEGLWP